MSFSRLMVAAAVLGGLFVFAFSHAAGPDYLASKPISLPAAKGLAVGDEVRTAAGERRRLDLPNGFVLLNEKTVLKRSGERDLELSSGEVFVTAGAALTVRAPRREVKGTNARFSVRTDAKDSSVVAASGQVQISGLDLPLIGGQQLPAGEERPSSAPRVSQVLSWTRELMTDGMVPASSHQGGSLVVLDAEGQEQRLALRRYHVDVHVEDGFARTTIDQTYFNHTHSRQEGTFRFPLPPDASLSRLAMYVDGKLNEGGMVEKDYGRMVYERIKYEQRDPALLEWIDGSTFSMRVFPLEPRQEKRILLSYTQRLGSLYSLAAYRFPAGHDLTAHDFSVHVRVKGGGKAGWQSTSHSFKESKDGDDLLLETSAKDARIDRDIVLNLADTAGKAEPRFSSAEQDGSKYLLLRFPPPLAGEAKRAPRDWIFLFESSGDRDPVVARTQIEIIRNVLQAAGPDDRFNVLTADTRVHAFAHGNPVAITPQQIQQAVEFMEKTHLIGALDLGQALKLEALVHGDVRNAWLVHVGSGIAAMGERRHSELVRRIPEGTHYVGVGVGRRWNRSLMKLAAEKTGGYFTQINPDEPVAWRAFDLAATLDTPRLLDVKVTDRDGKTAFLPFTTVVAQGEELAAVARIDAGGSLPEAIVVSGALDGKPYREELKVEDIKAKAGYLPRTWGKLEIDRLLAEDAAKHKGRIIELSKAMYVISPFTSLLVLENEEMYQQFKVDRGRKDHWASYPALERIEVVYEPEDGPPFDPRKGIKPSPEQVRKTLLVREAPVVLRSTTAFTPSGRPASFLSGGEQAVSTSAGMREYLNGVARMSPASSVFYDVQARGGDGLLNYFTVIRENRTEIDRSPRSSGEEAARAGTIDRVWNGASGKKLQLEPPAPVTFAAARFGDGEVQDVGTTAATIQGQSGRAGGNAPLLFVRPRYQDNDTLYFNLVAYAPDLNTTAADILATLEQEAASDGSSKRGAIDDGARQLLDQARGHGWRSWEVPGDPGWTVTFDGADRWAWDRRLPSGLSEKVICEGKLLWHVYPEIGLAARRSVSRFHRLALSAIVPWSVASAKDLTHGADVRLRGDNTVAIVPHDARPRGRDGKHQPYRELHLVFAKDGSLAARRVVEVPSEKVLYQEELTPEGTVRQFDSDGKEVAVIKGTLSPAKAPSLKADVEDLVVLPLPYRVPEHVKQALHIEKKASDALTFDEGRALLGAWFAAGNGEEALRIFRECFHRRDQRHIGYYVLLAACGQNLDAEHVDILSEHRDAPLAQYLALCSSPVLRKHASQWAAAGNPWGDGFLGRLATTHALCQRWSDPKIDIGKQAELDRALAFIRRHNGSAFGWAVLGLVADRAADAEAQGRSVRRVHEALAKVWPLFADIPTLHYSARYEEARSLWKAGEGKAAAKLFLDLYEKVLATGALPPIDGDFRAALLDASTGEAGWGQLLRSTADRLVKKGDRAALLGLARQCWQLGDAAAAQRVYDMLHDDFPVGKDHVCLLEATLDFLQETSQLSAADELLQAFLGTPSTMKAPRVLRRAHQLAKARNMPQRELDYLERLLEQEFEDSQEGVDLRTVRTEYTGLLDRYEEQAKALQSLGLALPGDFSAKVVRAADRWRAMDRDNDEPCRVAARIFQTVRSSSQAWDYLTTPVGRRPNEAGPWAELAATLARQGNWDLADNAYGAACEADPTNAQVLWDRARNLTQAGRLDVATPLYRRLADGTWPPQYRGLQEQARLRAANR